MDKIIIELSIHKETVWTVLLAVAPIIVAIIAIIVPTEIAKKQNKITLYEKRLECYQQFEALKSFYKFVGMVQEFKRTGDNLIWQCQQSYYNAHLMLNDGEFQRNKLNGVFQRMYAVTCLEKDKAMFLSLKLLIAKPDNFQKIEVAIDSLENFVSILFPADTEFDSINQDAISEEASLRNKYYQKMTEAKNLFCQAFSDLLTLEKRFEEMLKIQG